jgi:hypothetical protein
MIATSHSPDWMEKKKKERDPNIRDDRSNIKCVTSLTRACRIYTPTSTPFFFIWNSSLHTSPKKIVGWSSISFLLLFIFILKFFPTQKLWFNNAGQNSGRRYQPKRRNYAVAIEKLLLPLLYILYILMFLRF